MEYKKIKLVPLSRQQQGRKSARITVRGYTGEFNTQGKEFLGTVCKAWALPLKHPAALALHTPLDTTEYQVCAVPVQVATDTDVPVIVNEDSTTIKVDLYTYMHSINLHLGGRTRWVIYLQVDLGVDGKPCLFLDTQTDLEKIRREQKAAQDGSAKSGQSQAQA
jgi:hypothetical protein